MSTLPWGPNARFALWGWGKEGQAAYHWIRRQEPSRPLQVWVPQSEIAGINALNDPQLQVIQSSERIDFTSVDWVIKSPGISPNRDDVQTAISRGVRFVGGTYLWALANGNAQQVLTNTICITGTKGKSTTSALTAHLLRAGGYRTLLAGNIGLPLLDAPPSNDGDTLRVIELSSYQTQDLAASGMRPQVAVVVNIFPEHLDWHGSEAAYVNDKLALVTGAHPLTAVLNASDKRLTALELPKSDIQYFGNDSGWHLRGDDLYHADRLIMDTRNLPLPGRHNRGNLCAALTAIQALGIDAEPLAQHALTFMPLPNRLQNVGERGGIRYVNDSISTTPHATLAALDCYGDTDIAVIVGGHDRGLDWQDFGAALRTLRSPPIMIAAMGQKGPEIHATLRDTCMQMGITLQLAPDLASAFAMCKRALQDHQGGLLLMSPGAPSFDAYRDYVARGKHFAQLAGFDPESIVAIPGLGIA